MKKFYALQPHVAGSTVFAIGDVREADENEVQHLIELGVLGDEKPAPLQEQADEFSFDGSERIEELSQDIKDRDATIERLNGELQQVRDDSSRAMHTAQEQFDVELKDANARADDAVKQLADVQQALTDMTARAEVAEKAAADLQKPAAKAGK